MLWWQYLLLANLYLALFFGFYVLLLRKETFFQLNRLYLTLSAMLAFVLPLIQADWVQKLFITQQVKYAIYNSPVIVYEIQAAEKSTVSLGQMLSYLYLAGLAVVSLRFVWQIVMLRRLMQQQTEGAYAFFNKVNVHGELSEHAVVSAHEEVHVRQWHSADVLLIELISIVAWFNPVIYLYRKAIKHTHEFIADKLVIDAGADKADYALLLLNQTLNVPAHSMITPFFNHSLLKQRILMLQKSRSARVKLLKYGLSAPLFVVMLILSSATIDDSQTIERLNFKANEVLGTPLKTVIATTSDQIVSIVDSVREEGMQPANRAIVKFPPPPPPTVKDTVPAKDKPVFTAVEKNPEFPGGLEAFGRYLSTNIKYPKADRDANRQGRVFLQFIVEEDGGLSGLKVLRGITATMDAEAMRVLKASPKWMPGLQNGKPVRVLYTVPIQFSLANANEDKSKTVNDTIKYGYSPASSNYKGTAPTITFREARPQTYPARVEKLVITGRPANRQDTANTFSISYRKPDTINLASPALILLDGKVISKAQMAIVPPSSIKSIDVLKSDAATVIYGEKARNGVILIKSKSK